MTGTDGSITCPINNLPAHLYCQKERANYYIEPRSGTIFQVNMPAVADMNQYADQEYSGGAYQEYAKARHLKLATAQRRLGSIDRIAPGKRLLNVGCATGFFMEAAAEHGYDVQGVEFSTVAIAQARPDIRERIVRGDVNALSTKAAGKFDVVTAFDIIEHVQDPAKFLKEIYDVLVPGGLLVITTPNTDHFLRFVMRSKWPMLQPMQHTVLFSKRSMVALLEQCGYRDIQSKPEHKVLALDYLADQLEVTNPSLHRIYKRLHWLVPGKLRRKPFAVNIGELIAYARKSG